MVYITVEDFYRHAASCTRLSRDEEKQCAQRMKNGDETARRQIVESYLPMVAGHIKHTNNIKNKLSLALYCISGLEKAVDSFDFMQDSESFAHRLGWVLRQTTVAYIAG